MRALALLVLAAAVAAFAPAVPAAHCDFSVYPETTATGEYVRARLSGTVVVIEVWDETNGVHGFQPNAGSCGGVAYQADTFATDLKVDANCPVSPSICIL